MTDAAASSELSDLLSKGGLRLDLDGPIARVTLDRPRTKNSQTPATWLALAAIGDALPADTRVVIVRGAEGNFSSGLDRSMLSPPAPDSPDTETGDSVFGLLRLTDEQMADQIASYQQGFTWLRRPDVVSIAVVEGWAIGAGFQLALACDLRVVSEDAQFCMKEPALGLVPDLTGTKPLVELVGYGRALEICATARNVGAAEALAIGLANVVAPAAEVGQVADDLAGAVLANLPGAVSGTKALLQGAAARDLEAQCRAEREAQVGRFREMAALLGA